MFHKDSKLAAVDAAVRVAREQIDAAINLLAKQSAAVAAKEQALQAAAQSALTGADIASGELARLSAEVETYVRVRPLAATKCLDAIQNIPAVARRDELGKAATKIAEAKKLDDLAAPFFRRLGEILEIPCDKRMGHYQPVGSWLHLPDMSPATEDDTPGTMAVDPGNRRPFATPKPEVLRAEAREHEARAARFEKLAIELVPHVAKKPLVHHDHLLHNSPISIFAAAQDGLRPPEPMPLAEIQISDLENLFSQALAGVGCTE